MNSDHQIGFIVGARPNFMKVAPILKVLRRDFPDVGYCLIHTGQHYDESLSEVFFKELGIPEPDVHLNVGSGSHGQQTARIIERCEEVFVDRQDNGIPITRLVVVGDVNSTLAATLAASKLQIPIAHVEAGLRSFDRTMPEEINRIVTDVLCDKLLVSDPAGIVNLKNEGRQESEIDLVGNVMIDTLLENLQDPSLCERFQQFGVDRGEFGVVTFHRPSNVDTPEVLGAIVDVLATIAQELPLVFPIHPRTRAALERFDLVSRLESSPGIKLHGPLGYLDCLALTSNSKVVVTDSGGLQEETTVMRVPCLTMRQNTERPITVSEGSSTLIGNDAEQLANCLRRVLDNDYEIGTVPEMWDGKAAERIVAAVTS